MVTRPLRRALAAARGRGRSEVVRVAFLKPVNPYLNSCPSRGGIGKPGPWWRFGQASPPPGGVAVLQHRGRDIVVLALSSNVIGPPIMTCSAILVASIAFISSTPLVPARLKPSRRDQERLEGEAHVVAFHCETVVRVRRFGRLLERLRHVCLGIGPRSPISVIIGKGPQRLEEFLVGQSRCARRGDAQRLEMLAHHLAHQLDGVGRDGNDQKRSGLSARIFVTSAVMGTRIVSDRPEHAERACLRPAARNP